MYYVPIRKQARGFDAGNCCAVLSGMPVSSLSHVPDLDAYFRRIGYDGPREPTRPVLDALMALHTRAIPFENLDVLLGRGVSLAPEAVEAKLVGARRGGYCFEQNSFFLSVLRTLGFRATPLSGRVRLYVPREVVPPRTHLFLKVGLDGGEWLADVGFGGMSLTSAIRFQADLEQETRHEPRRLVREDGRWFHQVRSGDGWVDGYEFTGEEMPPIDRELANWWTSAHPESRFRHNLMVSLAGPDCTRLNLTNSEFVRRRGAEVLETTMLGSHDELVALLGDVFGIRIPTGARLEAPNLDWSAA